MTPVHPGRVLKRELEARRLSANALAIALRTPSGRITDILNGKRGVSPETAMRLARYFFLFTARQGSPPRMGLTRSLPPTGSLRPKISSSDPTAHRCR